MYSIREGSIAALAKAERRPGERWQAGVFEAPLLVRTEMGPARPPIVLVVEAESGFLFVAKLCEPGTDADQAVGDGLVEAMGTHGVVPGEVEVAQGRAAGLNALAQALGVRFTPAESMPALRRAYAAMSAKFKK
jgi:hypothetical protein